MSAGTHADKWRQIWLHVGLTPLAIIWLFPLWMMFVFSTMPDRGIFSPDIVFWPSGEFLDNVRNLQADTDFIRHGYFHLCCACLYSAFCHVDLYGWLGVGALPVFWQGGGAGYYPWYHDIAFFRCCHSAIYHGGT